MKRITKRLDKENSQISVNKDFGFNIPINQTNRLLPLNEVDRMVNQYEQFNKERNLSSKYRVLGTIKTLFSNPLFDVMDNTNWGSNIDCYSWETFSGTSFLNSFFTTGSTYSQSVNDNLTEVDGWFGFTPPFNPSATTITCSRTQMTPNLNCFTMTPSVGEKNWDLFVTYPFSSDTTHYMVEGGLLIVEIGTIEVGGIEMNTIRTAVKHGLRPGNDVSLSGLSPMNVNTILNVKQLGYENGEDLEYVFVVDTEILGNQISPTLVNGRMRRMVGTRANNRAASTYYFRLFKPITNIDGYENYPLPFAKNIYSDPTSQYVFNGGTGTTEDIIVSGYIDNLNRPLSELYLTMVKNDNIGFGKVSSGLDIPYTDSVANFPLIPDTHRIHNGGAFPVQSHKYIESGVTFNNEYFYGDLVEYNIFTLNEVVLSTVEHRFNTQNREENDRQEGYYYKAHHLMLIREFSEYIEQNHTGNTITTNMPSYLTDLGDGRLLWRDFLPIGFDGAYETSIDYPFTNGAHYIYKNIYLNLRRQDPFAKYGIYHNTGPDINNPIDTRDPFGDPIDTEKYKINRGCDEC